MIRLTHLKVNNFKQLCEVDLKFPERFCALVEGLNEAGKSTLLESIYFGLYGKGLATAGGLTSLITHGSQSAEVMLGVIVHDVQLEITRKLRSSGTSQAKVEIIRPDRTETVTGVVKTNKEVLAYLNNLDGESLLASCFVQQKKLGGLEELGVSERQKILLRLLDMDRLSSMGGSFKWGLAEKRELDTARKRFRLAQATSEIAEGKAELERLERLLAMAKIHATLEEAETFGEIAKFARDAATNHQAESSRLKAMISRIEALDRIITLLDQTLRAREVITGREQDLAKVSSNLSHIDRLEQKTLPNLQADLVAIDGLREQILQVASMEKENEEINRRAECLRGAITRAGDLAGPKMELEQLGVCKEKAIGEKNELNRFYEAARKAETLKETIVRIDLEISQAEQRKDRLVATIERSRNLNKKYDQAQALVQKLKALNQAILDSQARVEAAKSIQDKQADIERLEKLVITSSERELSLRQLHEQASTLNARKQGLTQFEKQLSSLRAELEKLEERYLQAQQANALQRWAAAKHDEDIRAKQGQKNVELKAKAEQARGRQKLAQAMEQSAQRIALIGWSLTGVGILASGAGIFINWILTLTIVRTELSCNSSIIS